MPLAIADFSVSRAHRQVVHEVSLVVDSGSITALLGANGAGKSSLVLGLAGRAAATGEATLDGRPIARSNPNRARRFGLAAVPEGHFVFGSLTVLDNLRAAALAPGDEARLLDATFEVFPELSEIRDRRAGNLSGGQQQMLAIGQALMSEPKYLLIDELSLGLAPIIVSRLVAAITEVASTGVGVLLIEQHAHLALGVADRAAVMSAGHLSWTGPPSTLDSDPAILRRAYLGTGEALISQTTQTEERT